MKHPRRVTQWIHYTKLVRSAFQFYGEITEEIQTLAMLIKAEGEVLQNVIVRKTDVDEYEIIAGHKRVLACKYLVEEGKAEEFAFVPCDVKSMNDIRAQFQVMSSNYHHSKSDYEKMKEVSDMKYLMEHYPEEFPDVAAGGRVVEHLAAQLHMKRSTVSEYLAIDHNLIPEGKEAFKESKLNKSAACAMAALPEEEQEKLLTEGKTTQCLCSTIIFRFILHAHFFKTFKASIFLPASTNCQISNLVTITALFTMVQHIIMILI